MENKCYTLTDMKILFGAEGVQRCDNCERFREEKGLGDFVCRHVRGYKEAPSHIR